jgi:hypothetical protein
MMGRRASEVRAVRHTGMAVTLGVFLVVVVMLTLVLALPAGAAAKSGDGPASGHGKYWSDLTREILHFYDVTQAELATFSIGYPDGTWRPYVEINRAQMVAAIVIAYGIPLVNPAEPTYTDVPVDHPWYQHVETATAVGLVRGVSPGVFNPDGTVQRQQAAAILVRWLASQQGFDLATMYTEEEVDAILGAYPDGAAVSPALRREVAFASDFEIIRADESGYLSPTRAATRIEAASMIVHSLDVKKWSKQHCR